MGCENWLRLLLWASARPRLDMLRTFASYDAIRKPGAGRAAGNCGSVSDRLALAL